MNKYKAIFFDLDGTLLPMELNNYIEKYFYTLNKKFDKEKFDTSSIFEGIKTGLYLMYKNNGLKTNEEVFWDNFSQKYPNSIEELTKIFLDYYDNEYNDIARDVIAYKDLPQLLVNLRSKGYLIICATNPLYPQKATIARLKWAGIDEKYFDFITSYENSHYSKPNILYYEELLKKFSLKATEVLMVGNDVYEDLIFKTLNAETYLITDYLRNEKNINIETDYQGTFEEFSLFAKNIL